MNELDFAKELSWEVLQIKQMRKIRCCESIHVALKVNVLCQKSKYQQNSEIHEKNVSAKLNLCTEYNRKCSTVVVTNGLGNDTDRLNYIYLSILLNLDTVS